jgi:hypothetical protein
MDEGILSGKSLSLGIPEAPQGNILRILKCLSLGTPSSSIPSLFQQPSVFYLELYFYSSHIMIFAWSVLYYMRLCLFCFLVCHNYPCWTHLFERAKIRLWFVRIALYASLKFFELWNCSSASFISFWERCALIFLKKCSHASLRLILELVNFWRNSLMLHLYYFERRKFYAHVLHLDLFELVKSNCNIWN